MILYSFVFFICLYRVLVFNVDFLNFFRLVLLESMLLIEGSRSKNVLVNFESLIDLFNEGNIFNGESIILVKVKNINNIEVSVRFFF